MAFKVMYVLLASLDIRAQELAARVVSPVLALTCVKEGGPMSEWLALK